MVQYRKPTRRSPNLIDRRGASASYKKSANGEPARKLYDKPTKPQAKGRRKG